MGPDNFYKMPRTKLTETTQAALMRFVGSLPATPQEKAEAAPTACKIIAQNCIVNFAEKAKALGLNSDLTVVYQRAGNTDICLVLNHGVEDPASTELMALHGENLQYESLFIEQMDSLLGVKADYLVPTNNTAFCCWEIPAKES